MPGTTRRRAADGFNDRDAGFHDVNRGVAASLEPDARALFWCRQENASAGLWDVEGDCRPWRNAWPVEVEE